MLPLGMALPPPAYAAPQDEPVVPALASLRPVVRAVVVRVLGGRGNDADIEDCTNETLRRALEGRERLEPGSPLTPWVVGIARHVALDAARARVRARARAVNTRDDQDDPVERLVDSSPGPDLLLQRAEVKARVRAALTSLNDDQRRALEMFHLEGLAYRDIAERMQVPLGTVCTWVSRGRRALARAFPEGREP